MTAAAAAQPPASPTTDEMLTPPLTPTMKPAAAPASPKALLNLLTSTLPAPIRDEAEKRREQVTSLVAAGAGRVVEQSNAVLDRAASTRDSVVAAVARLPLVHAALEGVAAAKARAAALLDQRRAQLHAAAKAAVPADLVAQLQALPAIAAATAAAAPAAVREAAHARLQVAKHVVEHARSTAIDYSTPYVETARAKTSKVRGSATALLLHARETAQAAYDAAAARLGDLRTTAQTHLALYLAMASEKTVTLRASLVASATRAQTQLVAGAKLVESKYPQHFAQVASWAAPLAAYLAPKKLKTE